MEGFSIITDKQKQNDTFKSIFECVSKESCIDSEYSSVANGFDLWNYIKKNISDAKNKVAFNIFSNQNKLDVNKTSWLRIFDTNYDPSKQNDNCALVEVLNNIVWFSYRSNIETILYNNNKYNSDGGWGCMIRCGQMILSKGIMMLFDIKNIQEFLKEKIMLFLDEKISIERIKTVKGFKKILSLNQHKSITPPFSLKTIVLGHPTKAKGPGDWFSNYDVAQIFTALHNQYSPLSDDNTIEIINFNEGTFILSDIIEKCFTKTCCSCVAQSFVELSNEERIVNDFVVYCDKNESRRCHCFDDKFKFDNEYYTFKKKFIIFISVRHGLNEIEKEMYSKILSFFDFENNIGIIGGKQNRALYFIGKCEDNLIFLDPHYVQNAVTLQDIQQGEGGKTYIPQNIYYLNISEISPSMTLGFVVRNQKEFDVMLKRIEAMTKDPKEISLFDYKERRRTKKRNGYDPLAI